MKRAFDFNTHPLTSKLTNVESVGQDKWRASCPCGRNHKNADKNKSLTVEYDKEKETLLVYCFTGCSVAEICQETGCSVSDLFIGKNPAGFLSWYAEKNGLTFIESYSYCYGSYNDGLCKIRFRLPDGTKDFRWICEDDTKKSGFAMHHSGTHRLYVAGNINNNTVFVVEGEKDANTVHNLINATAVSVENGAGKSTGGKWRTEYNQQLTGKNVYILWDNDDVGKNFALVEAQQIAQTAAAVFLLDLPQAWPDCPEKADITDFVKDVGPEEATLTLQEMIANAEEYAAPEPPVKWDDTITQDYPAASQDPQQGTETINGVVTHIANPDAAKPAAPDPAAPAAPWEPITKGEALPAFPLEYLPGWIKDYIVNFSENTGISKDFCAACVFGAVSIVICGHMNIHFNGTHYEPANLYTVFVGRSGSMKSTAIKEFVGPARTWLMEKNIAVKAYNKGITAEIETIEKELTKEQRKRTGRDEKQIEELKSRIENKHETMQYQYPVPFTDVVPESIIRSMTNTNGAATIAAAEGNIINVLTGRSYTQRGAAPNLDIFLAGHDGEPYHGIRVTSGEVEIPRANISILMAIQPTLLETLCRSADANGRGLVQRFLIFAPDEPENTIDHTQANTTDPNHARRWNEHIRTIAERFMQPNAAPITMELFSDADMIIRECWNYEKELINERGAADEDGITGWISKLHGKALRLSAILAVIDEPKAINITKEHAETAVALLKEYFIPHYIGSYETADILTREERKIIGWIIRRSKKDGSQESFSEHELKQAIRRNPLFSDRKGPERFRIAIEGLQDKNYIRPLKTRKSGNGRKPGPAWQINPELFTE